MILPESISEYRLTRGLGGKIVVQYMTHWDETETTSWEHEEELKQYGSMVVQLLSERINISVGGGC